MAPFRAIPGSMKQSPSVPPDARPQSAVRDALEAGWRATVANWIPGGCLTLVAVILILLYTYVSPVTAFFDNIAAARERVGLPFGMLSTALFGGALPLVFRRFVLGRIAAIDEVVFSVTFWAYKGIEVGALYELQAWLWGEGTDVTTIALKVALDQGIYCPLVAVPTMVLGYLWQANGFRWRSVRVALQRKGYWARSLPVLITNAALWIPAVTVIYLFPTPLQLILQNLILSIWVLLLAFLSSPEEDS